MTGDPLVYRAEHTTSTQVEEEESHTASLFLFLNHSQIRLNTPFNRPTPRAQSCHHPEGVITQRWHFCEKSSCSAETRQLWDVMWNIWSVLNKTRWSEILCMLCIPGKTPGPHFTVIPPPPLMVTSLGQSVPQANKTLQHPLSLLFTVKLFLSGNTIISSHRVRQRHNKHWTLNAISNWGRTKTQFKLENNFLLLCVCQGEGGGLITQWLMKHSFKQTEGFKHAHCIMLNQPYCSLETHQVTLQEWTWGRVERTPPLVLVSLLEVRGRRLTHACQASLL